MYIYPKSNLGKISFWVGVSAFVLMFLQYWTALILQNLGWFSDSSGRFFIIPGILVLLCVLASGVCAVVAIVKHKDRAILVFIPLVLGVFGLFLVIGEFLFPH